mgnify:CR=1 FL=1
MSRKKILVRESTDLIDYNFSSSSFNKSSGGMQTERSNNSSMSSSQNDNYQSNGPIYKSDTTSVQSYDNSKVYTNSHRKSKQSFSDDSIFGQISRACDNCEENNCDTKMCRDRGDHTTCISIEKIDCNDNCHVFLPEINEFSGMIIPAKSESGKCVMPIFRMRRKNKTVTFQWDEFSGIVAASGICSLQMNQPIPNLPPNNMKFIIAVTHRGENKMGVLNIINNQHFNVAFQFDTKNIPLQLNDSFSVASSAVQWIIK